MLFFTFQLSCAGANIVIKAPGDHRSYRFLHLSNGLTALLVHDPEIFPDGPPEASRAEDTEDVNMSGNENENEDEDDDEDDEGEDGNDEEEDGKGEGNGREDDDDGEENPVNYPTKKVWIKMKLLGFVKWNIVFCFGVFVCFYIRHAVVG